MTTMPKSSVTFADLRRLLEQLGFKERRIPKGVAFDQGEEILVYRKYNDDDLIFLRDLVNTRNFLDWWGRMDNAAFDEHWRQPSTSA